MASRQERSKHRNHFACHFSFERDYRPAPPTSSLAASTIKVPVTMRALDATDVGSPTSNSSDITIDSSAARHPRIIRLEEEWLNNGEPITVFLDNTTLLASAKRQYLQQTSTKVSKVLQHLSEAAIRDLDKKHIFHAKISDEITISSEHPALLKSIKQQCLGQKSAAASKVLRSYTKSMAEAIGDPTARQRYEKARELYDRIILLQKGLVTWSQPSETPHPVVYDLGWRGIALHAATCQIGGTGDAHNGNDDDGDADDDDGDADDDDGDADDDDGDAGDADDDDDRRADEVDLVEAEDKAFEIFEQVRDKLAEMASTFIREAEAMQHLEGPGDTAERPLKRRRVDAESPQARVTKRTRPSRIIRSPRV